MFCLRLDEASLFGAFGPGGIAQILFTDGAIFAACAVGVTCFSPSAQYARHAPLLALLHTRRTWGVLEQKQAAGVS